MIILHIIDVPKVAGNGVAVAVNNYAEYECKNNKVCIYCLNDNINNKNVEIYNQREYKHINDLPAPFNKPDVVIFNEVYKTKYISFYKYCKNNNIKYIIIPHGCLNKASQNHKKIKKIFANILLFNKFISNAAAIQFLNDKEMTESKFKYKKCIIHGNGMEIPSCINNCKNNNLVFIGRYDVKVKGLDIIAKMCQKYYSWFIENNVKIMLYGRTSKNGLEELKKVVNENNVSQIMIINGPVYSNDKLKILSECYGFIQTSRHEGQPMGILEALSIGVPCIVTYETSFGEYVDKNKCGYGTSLDIDEIFSKIKCLYMNKKNRDKFSENSRIKSIRDYEWSKIINDTCESYKIIIEG